VDAIKSISKEVKAFGLEGGLDSTAEMKRERGGWDELRQARAKLRQEQQQ